MAIDGTSLPAIIFDSRKDSILSAIDYVSRGVFSSVEICDEVVVWKDRYSVYVRITEHDFIRNARREYDIKTNK